MDRILRCHLIALYIQRRKSLLQIDSMVKKLRCRDTRPVFMIRSLALSNLRPMRLYGLVWTGLDSTFQNNIWWSLIRSKHNNLMNYFIHDKRDLSPAYVKSCEKFLKEISDKLQASSATERPQLKGKIKI